MLPLSIVKPIRELLKTDLFALLKLSGKICDFSDSIENEDATCTENSSSSSLLSASGKQMDPDEPGYQM